MDKGVDNLVARAVGLATEDEQDDRYLTIGFLPFITNQKAIEALISQHNSATVKKLKALPKNAPKEQRDELMMELAETYEKYLHFSKFAPKVRNDLLEAQIKFEHAERVASSHNLPAFKQRMRDYKLVGKHLDPGGDYGEELKRQEKFLNKNDPDKLVTEAQMKEEEVGKKYVEPLINFATFHYPEIHTPDWEGYLQYLKIAAPDMLQMARKNAVAVRLKERDLERHTYIVGGTGSGKSELIKQFVFEHATTWLESVVVLDPHGEMVGQMAKWDIQDFNDRLTYLDPYLEKDGSRPFTINPLQPPKGCSAQEREVIAQQLVGAFEEMLKGSGGTGITVNMRAVLTPCLLVLLDAGDKTLIDLQTFLNDEHNDQLIALGRKSARPAIARFFEREFSDRNFTITKQSLRTKLQSLFNSGVFYDLVNGPTTVDLETLIQERRIILFNLAKGIIGPEASEALGRFVIALLQGIALRRQGKEQSARAAVHLFIDECQNYIGNSTVTILEEARKYGMHLTLAQQVAGRGMSPEMRTVVLNNTNVKIVGRTSEDQRMAKLLGVELEDVQQLAVGAFYGRAGNGTTFHFHGFSELLGDSHAMREPDWEMVRLNQLDRYYRPRTGQPDPAPDNVELI